MSGTPYDVDVDSIRGAFPPGTGAPSLLLDFAAWLKGRPWGSAGCYQLVGQFSDDAPIVDGSPLREHFALFMRLPEGSVVGFWLGADCGARFGATIRNHRGLTRGPARQDRAAAF
jgi:hypothetical protein